MTADHPAFDDAAERAAPLVGPRDALGITALFLWALIVRLVVDHTTRGRASTTRATSISRTT